MKSSTLRTKLAQRATHLATLTALLIACGGEASPEDALGAELAADGGSEVLAPEWSDAAAAGSGAELARADQLEPAADEPAEAEPETDAETETETETDTSTDSEREDAVPARAASAAPAPATPQERAQDDLREAEPAQASGDDQPAREVALKNPAPGAGFFVGANFWNLGWQGARDYFPRDTDFTTTEDPWRTDFIEELAPYHVLRFMDWTLTNDSDNAQAHWETRLSPREPQTGNVALEWQLDLCNRAQTDCWLTVPHEADEVYWEQLAHLVHEKLDPRLRVYVEWSNEVWNAQFPQREYAAARGGELGLAGADKAAAYYVYEAVRVFEAFEAVFGEDNPRVVKVLAGQAANAGHCGAHLEALADPAINPNGTRADVYAIAPYVRGHSLPEIESAFVKLPGWVEQNTECAAEAQLPVITYEGGPDSFGQGNVVCRALQRDPGMRDTYRKYLDALHDAKLLGPYMQYTHSGDCWGLKPTTGESLESSPKYRALLEWLDTHPAPANPQP